MIRKLIRAYLRKRAAARCAADDAQRRWERQRHERMVADENRRQALCERENYRALESSFSLAQLPVPDWREMERLLQMLEINGWKWSSFEERSK